MLVFGKYLLVGVVNTLIGFGFIFLFVFLGLGAELANLLGYCIGITCSYFLNKYFTFKARAKNDFLKFILSMLLAYGVNLLVLIVCFRFLSWDIYLSQCLAGVSYTLVGFLLSKGFVWGKGQNQNT